MNNQLYHEQQYKISHEEKNKGRITMKSFRGYASSFCEMIKNV